MNGHGYRGNCQAHESSGRVTPIAKGPSKAWNTGGGEPNLDVRPERWHRACEPNARREGRGSLSQTSARVIDLVGFWPLDQSRPLTFWFPLSVPFAPTEQQRVLVLGSNTAVEI